MYNLGYAERPQPDNHLSFMLHDLVFLGYHRSPLCIHTYFTTLCCVYNTETFRCGILFYQSFANRNSDKQLVLINKQWFFVDHFRFRFGSRIQDNQHSWTIDSRMFTDMELLLKIFVETCHRISPYAESYLSVQTADSTNQIARKLGPYFEILG